MSATDTPQGTFDEETEADKLAKKGLHLVPHWTGHFTVAPAPSEGAATLILARLDAVTGLLLLLSEALRECPPENMKPVEAEDAVNGVSLLVAEARALVKALDGADE